MVMTDSSSYVYRLGSFIMRLTTKSAMAVILFTLFLGAQLSVATTLYLYQDCNDAPSAAECYTTVSGVQERLWGTFVHPLFTTPTVYAPNGTRNPASELPVGLETLSPSTNTPVKVMIGPGDFVGRLACSILSGVNPGNVSFQGIGPETTSITYSASDYSSPFNSYGCGNLSFEDMSFVNAGTGDNASGANFLGALWADVRWLNVTLNSEFGVGWRQSANYGPPTPNNCQGVSGGKHLFYSARIFGARAAMASACEEVSVYGSDLMLVSNPASGTFFNASLPIVAVHDEGVINIYGSTVRTDLSVGLPAGQTSVTGIEVGNGIGGGVVNMHGGIVNVTTISTAGVDAVGVNTFAADSRVSTLGTPFFLRSASDAQSIRLQGPGSISSPQYWQAGTSAPEEDANFGDLVSKDGQDMYVETDCNASGCTNGDKPHLMLYSEACGVNGTPWFDTVTKQCRQ